MYKILEFREKIKVLYSKYSMYIDAALKFIIALVGMIVINSSIGTMSVLKNPLVVVIVALVGALVPKSITVMILMLTIVAHVFSIAMEAAAVVLVIFVLMYLLFFRFTSKESIVLVIMPVLFFLNIPYILPILLGLAASPVSIVSVAFGTLVYFILNVIGQNYDAIVKLGNEDGFKVLSMLIDDIFANPAFYFTIIAFAMVLVLVYVLKRLSMDYSWIIAACAGGIFEIIVFVIGNVMLDMSLVCSVLSAVLGGLISVALAWFLQFFIHSVDYTRTERVQFEDDDYYYYVKAVPKVKVAIPEMKNDRVRKVNAKQSKKAESVKTKE